MEDLTPEDKAHLAASHVAEQGSLNNHALKVLTKENASDVIGKLWRAAEKEIKAPSCRVENRGQLEAYKKNLESWRSLMAENLMTNMGRLDSVESGSIREYIHSFRVAIAGEGYKLDSNNTLEEELLREYMKIQGYIFSGIKQKLNNEESNLFKPPPSLGLKCEGVSSDPVSGKLFSELHVEFLKHKIQVDGLSEAMQKSYRRYLQVWLEYIGDDDLEEVSKKKVKKFLFAYLNMPKRNVNPYKKMSILECLELEVPDSDKVAPKTVGDVKKWLQGVFAYAVDELGVISESPVRDLKLNLKKSPSYAAYEDSEILTMLDYVDNNVVPAWAKIMVPLAIYTGARRGELVQLKRENLKFDQGANRHYLLITDKGEGQRVKTESGIRQIPLHQELISRKFVEFVEQANDRIFEGLKSSQVTKWFGEFRKKCEIECFDDYGQRKVFHSFRHTFVTKSRGGDNASDKVQQVVGHEKISVGETDRYTHNYQLKELLNVVDCIAFKN